MTLKLSCGEALEYPMMLELPHQSLQTPVQVRAAFGAHEPLLHRTK